MPVDDPSAGPVCPQRRNQREFRAICPSLLCLFTATFIRFTEETLDLLNISHVHPNDSLSFLPPQLMIFENKIVPLGEKMTRFLPPLHCLRHFEAASRLKSFKEAAEELNLSQGAISQQVAELERFLEVSLFDRSPRKVTLTPAGERLAQTVGQALRDISQTSMEISRRNANTEIKVEVGPFFSARWLAPRITDFIRRHTKTNILLCHTVGRRLSETEVDVSIRWGDGQWPHFDVERLLEVDIQPVAAPASRLQIPQQDVQEMSHLLVHTQSRGDWAQWLRSADLSPELSNFGTVLDEANVAVQAVIAGRGIGMGYFPLMDPEIETGDLIPAHPKRSKAKSAYYLLKSPSARRSSAVADFCNWLHAEVRSMKSAPVTIATMMAAARSPAG